jgi:hypothetical protein
VKGSSFERVGTTSVITPEVLLVATDIYGFCGFVVNQLLGCDLTVIQYINFSFYKVDIFLESLLVRLYHVGVGDFKSAGLLTIL